MKKLKIFLAFFLFFCSGCDYDARLTMLEKKSEKISTTSISSATLRPGATGYSIIRFGLGNLTVFLSDIQPYANGSKVILQFGNPLSVDLTGLEATISWGAIDTNGLPSPNHKTKNINFAGTLEAAALTNIPIVLEETPPSQLGFVYISDVTHSGIQFR